jgi:hypothetical protein
VSTVAIPIRGGSVLVDEDKVDVISKYRWRVTGGKRRDRGRQSQYAHSQVRVDGGKFAVISMHRLLTNAPSGTVVDHIDGDGLNNTIQNLRLCTHAQNNRNVHARWGEVSFKGVIRSKSRRRYIARVKTSGRVLYLGTFDDAYSAALAYDRAARHYYGEFANTNFDEDQV